MSETDMISVGDPLPRIASVEPGNGRYHVRVAWCEGARAGWTDTVDLAPHIFTFKVFRPLRDDADLFARVRLGDYGRAIGWPGNDDLDIGADALEEMAAETMTNADFSALLKRAGLTYDAAAAHLGIARRLVAYYAKEREIPRYIALACRQLEQDLGGRETAGTSFARPARFYGGAVSPDPTAGPTLRGIEGGTTRCPTLTMQFAAMVADARTLADAERARAWFVSAAADELAGTATSTPRPITSPGRPAGPVELATGRKP